ncbi:hypothetical protein PQX77_014567 [Marasmius sp. AFHP31]|nr:hypothetical protein PQX77_014567 [Marasmius sp. AFHP31]
MPFQLLKKERNFQINGDSFDPIHYRPTSARPPINHVSGGRNSVGGLVYATAGWGNGASAAEIQAQKDLLKQCIDILEGLEPGTASYINERSLYEPNSQWTYFGKHYDGLLGIKGQYDPQGLFVVAFGVGSERWDDSLNCRSD